MHLLYCDETNLQPRANDFFVYGGIFIPGDRALSLSRSLDEARRNAGIQPDFALKFNPGPHELTHAQFIAIKQRVIELVAHNNCIFLSDLIMHGIATDPDLARRNSINTICFHYDTHLNSLSSHGVVLIDRFEDNVIDSHLREKFSIGITGLPYTPVRRLENITGFHYSAIGQSHFGSVIDIVLGSFRFAINAFTRNETARLETAGTILRLLAPLFLRDDRGKVRELSLSFSPKRITAPPYLVRYEALQTFLAQNGIESEQHISAERR